MRQKLPHSLLPRAVRNEPLCTARGLRALAPGAGISVAARPFMRTGYLYEQAMSEARSLDASELAAAAGMSVPEIGELVEYGSLSTLEGEQGSERFSAEWVAPLQAAARLRRDFDLELFVTALLLEYLRRIDVLERELRALGARVP